MVSRGCLTEAPPSKRYKPYFESRDIGDVAVKIEVVEGGQPECPERWGSCWAPRALEHLRRRLADLERYGKSAYTKCGPTPGPGDGP